MEGKSFEKSLHTRSVMGKYFQVCSLFLAGSCLFLSINAISRNLTTILTELVLQGGPVRGNVIIRGSYRRTVTS